MNTFGMIAMRLLRALMILSVALPIAACAS
jgi:hypothetical protein